ncbi:MAG: serine/threonine-protein phosphatase [Rhodanobacteraceae bacterium]|jgi:protein phosphatase|nr:serine/threonine-protein phosphatase [Rhodanobacteraceae bacterium]
MHLHAAFCTHRGSPPGQQDAVLVGTRVHQAMDLEAQVVIDHGMLAAIADGLAVSPRSGRVSRTLLELLPAIVREHPDWLRDDLLANRHLREAHTRLCDRAERSPGLRGGASTLVAAQVREDRVAILNCGDSRAYLRRADGDIGQLSRDHTELQRLRDAGIAGEGVEYASLYDMLTDCIGTDPDDSDFSIHRVEARLAMGDLLVPCSDGVHDVLAEADWHRILRASGDPPTLIAATRHAVPRAGAPDNFSVIALARTTSG